MTGQAENPEMMVALGRRFERVALLMPHQSDAAADLALGVVPSLDDVSETDLRAILGMMADALAGVAASDNEAAAAMVAELRDCAVNGDAQAMRGAATKLLRGCAA